MDSRRGKVPATNLFRLGSASVKAPPSRPCSPRAKFIQMNDRLDSTQNDCWTLDIHTLQQRSTEAVHSSLTHPRHPPVLSSQCSYFSYRAGDERQLRGTAPTELQSEPAGPEQVHRLLPFAVPASPMMEGTEERDIRDRTAGPCPGMQVMLVMLQSRHLHSMSRRNTHLRDTRIDLSPVIHSVYQSVYGQNAQQKSRRVNNTSVPTARRAMQTITLCRLLRSSATRFKRL